MRRSTLRVAIACTLLLPGVFSITAAQGVDSGWVEPDRVTLKVGHRLYPDFTEELTVELNERFAISDEGFEAVITRHLPDFAIQIKDGEKKIFSKSIEPNNPALWIVVYEDSVAVDSVWAFSVKGAPHYSRTSYIFFEILGMEYPGNGEKKGGKMEGEKE